MATILRHDARNALRMLRSHASFAWPALATMAVASGFLGVAVNLAVSLLTTVSPDQRAAVRPVAAVLVLAGVMVLAAACTNLATLAMSHYQARLAEFAIRASLGGTRALLWRQLLVEGVTLALAACALGGVFAHWSRQILFSWLSPEQAATVADGMTVGATLAAGAVSLAACALVFFGCARVAAGLGLPLLSAESENLAASARGARPRRRLVVVQVATACSLLFTATLLGDGMNHALRVGPGANAGEVAVIHTIAPTRYEDPARGRRFQLQALDRVSAMPGIASVAATSALPLVSVLRVGYARAAEGPFAPYDTITVSSRYFSTMQHGIVEGREFDARNDTVRADAAVINQTMARELFPAVSPVGRQLVDDNGQRLTIVGVALDARFRQMAEPVKPTVYLPLSSRYLSGFHFVARTAGEAAPRVAAIAGTIQAIDSARLERQTTLEDHLQTAVRRDRIAMVFVGACGVLILLFAISGPYLLTRHAVTSRYDELAVRLAVGARGPHVFGLVIAQAMRAAMAGVSIGVAVALTLAQALAGVTGITLSSATQTALAIGFVLLSLSAVAAAVPALKASRLSPAAALR